MSGLRRLFRGSGRALALVFAASVAWVLLDMAALRLSLGEAGGRLLREAAGRRPGPGMGLEPGLGLGLGRARPPRGPEAPAKAAGEPGAAPAGLGAGGSGPPPGAAPAGLGAGGSGPPPGAAPAGLGAGDSGPSPPPRHTPAPGRSGTGTALPGHAAHGSEQRPPGTARPGLAARDAGMAAQPGTEKMNTGQEETSSKTRFVLISKERMNLASPTVPRPGPHSAGNATRRRGKHKELGDKGSDGAHAATATAGATAVGGRSRTLGVTPRAAPAAAGTGQDGQKQKQAGSSPGMHRVLSMDVTLAPRDPRAPGQFGHPVAVPDDKQEEAKSRWKEGNFNVYLSDLIPVDRAIADTRPAGCSEQQVHDDLPSTSIIMCFVDEVWSTLLRSVHSVLSRSPAHLIEEIILVDDFSTKEYLKEQLDTYMAQFPKVKILHLQERHGLIRARLAGAEIAKGAVLTFLDSHVECNVGWLEPLLDRVRLRRTKVACPVIEVISDKDMSYMTVDNFQRGIFTWPMNFGWRQIPQEVIEKNKIKETDIIRCPVMAGGLFSIDKKYFSELGMYDPGLDVWGGENMEISFKVWMCGGEIEIVPCSRVGHIFRNDNPYSFPKDRVRTVERNLARVAEVWLDEYKELFYGHAYHLLQGSVDVGDLGQQIQLRKKLQCKTFRWYLQNVYPDLEAPLVKASGLLTNVALAGCIAVEGTTLVFEKCDVNSTKQQFNYTWLRLVQHGQLCLAPSGVLGAVGMRQCQPRSRSLAWLHRSLATAQPGLPDFSAEGEMDLVALFYWCQQPESEESSVALPEGVAVLYPLLTPGIVLSSDGKCSSCLHKDAAPALHMSHRECLTSVSTEHLISEQQHLPQPSCLAVHPSFRALRVTACDPTSPHQKWHFGSYHAD
ncbi:PREDICTED: polypeptide N-acetylgalactosaminyltransferase 5 [Sturnus vulgaris]|uniref:polypeptide N-acetylgalactosaminyltransferase 5 n=1 Tax=Sturnus vulgaris TaxID=9172 RepID=UPI00071A4CCF|nr:PREDICTED: polypeptide N-acetylgalactosaminyltransferase 5 [Sturnus vulgaris]